MDFEKFFNQYVETALWSTSDNSDESGGKPLDENYDESDIAPETIERMQEECRGFLSLPYVKEAIESRADDPWSHAGHDFWLTRNGHGAGFWDGDWTAENSEWGGQAGALLTRRSKHFSTVDLYVGDDGRIYQS